MAGFDNDTVYANNADFSVAGAGGGEATNGLQTNGQLWVGTTALNAGGTHINVLTLTPGTGISITQAATTLTIGAAGALATTYTENSGTANPAGNNLNLFGTNSALTGYSPWTTGTGSTVTLNMPGTVKWIVNATTGLGTHTTIQAAITAASSGDDVFITAGSYTENLTLKVGVNLVAFDADSTTPNVTIIGTCTLTTAGTVSISGIRLQTNSAALLAVTGSAASIVNLNRCYLNCTNNTGITFSSSSPSAVISLNYCFADIGTTGISLFTNTSSGTMYLKYTYVTNSGATSTNSTTSTSVVVVRHSEINISLATTSTGSIDAEYSTFSGFNVAAITTAGSGGAGFHLCYFQSGSSSAVSIGTGTTVSMTACDLNSSNTNVITGAGTLNATNLSFSGTSSVINPTTVSGTYTNLIDYKATAQPCFMAYNSSVRSNVTGNGATFTLIFDSEVFDQNNNFDGTSTFTAPVSGRYLLHASVYVQGNTIATSFALRLVTTGGTFLHVLQKAAGSQDETIEITAIASMAATNTCTATITVGGEAGNTSDVYGAAGDFATNFSGSLLC